MFFMCIFFLFSGPSGLGFDHLPRFYLLALSACFVFCPLGGVTVDLEDGDDT